MLSLGFLASNNGTAMRAVVEAIQLGRLDASASLVASNRRSAPALAFARASGIATFVAPTLSDPERADAQLTAAFETAGPDWIVLSGYLRRIGPRMLSAFGGRILNVHPALLPAFGGPGMYGRRVHEAVAAARPAFTGASIHLVDAQYDHGPVLARAEIPVHGHDTAETIERRVMALESKLMVATLQAIGEGRHAAIISDNLS